MVFRDQDGVETNQEYVVSLQYTVQDLQELVKTFVPEEDVEEYTFYHGPTEVRVWLTPDQEDFG